MTSAISLSGHLSLVGPRTGERGGKGDEASGQRFEDTLAGTVGKRGPNAGIARDEAQEEPRLWLLDTRIGSRIGLQTPDDGQPFDTGDAQADETAGNGTDEMTAGLPPAADGLAAKASTGLDVANQPAGGDVADSADAQLVRSNAAEAGDPDDTQAKQPAPEMGRTARVAAEASAKTALAGVGQAVAASNDQGPRVAQAGGVAPDADGEVRGPANRAGGSAAAQSALTGTRAVQPVAGGAQDSAQRPQSEANRRMAAGDGLATRASNTQSPAMAKQAGDGFEGRVSVIAAANTIAPAPTPVQILGSTSAGLVSEIAAAPGWRSAAQEAALTPGLRPGGQNGIQSLRIQLHPIELGMVTARLTQTGSQMSIEIQVESNDARQRLSNDADQIVKALKSIGIEVDKVTIQQAPQTTTTAAQQGGPRDTGAQSQQQASAEGGSNGRGGHGPDSQGDGARHGSETASDRAGGGVYI